MRCHCILCFEIAPENELFLLHDKYDHYVHYSCIGSCPNVTRCPVCKILLPEKIRLRCQNHEGKMLANIISSIEERSYDVVMKLAEENTLSIGLGVLFKELLRRYGLFDISNRSLYVCIYYYACCKTDYELIKKFAKKLSELKFDYDYGYIHVARTDFTFLKYLVKCGVNPSERTLQQVMKYAFCTWRENKKLLEYHWKKFPFSAPGPAAILGIFDASYCLTRYDEDAKGYLKRKAWIFLDLRGYICLRKIRQRNKGGNTISS